MTASILRIVFIALFGASAVTAAVRAQISSAFLVRGEQCLFEIRIEGREFDRIPEVPRVKNVAIEPVGFGRPQLFPGRRIESSYQFLVSSYAVGTHEIPPVEVIVNGTKQMTEPIRIEVFDPSELKWGDAASQPSVDKVTYASIIRIPDRKIYANQTVAAEIKIYVPDELARSIADWGVPEFERKGLAAWRFEPSESTGRVNLLGKPFACISYQTTMTPLVPGGVEIGPATVRLIYVKLVFEGFARRINIQATVDVPKLSFSVSPLPDGAPEGFDNAVGKFTIGTSIMETEVTEGEPLAMDVVISGSGNLDNLRSPKLVDPSGWKVYDSSPTQRGEERRELGGSVVFSQFLRPLEMKSEIPPFRLVYFDPEAERYETVMTEPIPLTMQPAAAKTFESSGPPPTLPLPVERMTDILGIIHGGDLLSTRVSPLPGWLIHAVGALLALALIAKALWMRYAHLLEKDEIKLAKRRDFENLAGVPADDGLSFLKAAGAFTERWLDVAANTELRRIIEERDRLCFRQSADVPGVSKGRRSEILRNLRRAAFGLIVLVFTLPSTRAEDASIKAVEAYNSSKFGEAAKIWLQSGPYEDLNADTLYNIGNASYRMGSPGHAALYYRRALARDSAHGEARQNLRFLERKFGAITVSRPAYQYTVAKIPLAGWKAAVWFGVWLSVLSLLVFPATRSGSRVRIAGIIGFIIGPMMMSIGGLGWRYFPDDAPFSPLERQAVVISEKSVLHTDAARTSPEVIDAPQGSLAEVIQVSGRWAYVSFATNTRGWLPVETIEMVIPNGPPSPPTLKKAAADGSST